MANVPWVEYELGRERAERAVADRERGFCGFCGASIPHRPGEGRCAHCVHYRPDSELAPPWESVT